MRNLYSTTAIFVMLIGSSTLKAEPIFTVELTPKERACQAALSACDEALKAADQVIKGKNAIIGAQDEQIKNLKTQVVEIREERDSLFKNPIVWFLVGFVAGGLSYAIASH